MSTVHRVLTVLCLWFLQALPSLAGPPATAPATAPAAGPPAEGAVDYARWLIGAIETIQSRLGTVAASADQAAEKYVESHRHIAVAGDRAFMFEAYGRSGGLMRMDIVKDLRHAREKKGRIVLLALREDHLQEDIDLARLLNQRDDHVVAFARPRLLDRARKAGVRFDAAIATPAAPDGGLYALPDGSTIVPTDSAAAIAAGWTWTAEFVAALTRRGKMPPMFLGYAVPGGRERQKRIGWIRFHEQAPHPTPRGKLGEAFLARMRQDALLLARRELFDIRAAAALALAAGQAGRPTASFLHGHAILAHGRNLPHDPNYLPQINRDWFKLKRDTRLTDGEFILAVGFDEMFRGRKYDQFAERARHAGAVLAWSFTDYKPAELARVGPGEVFIDQGWAFGDAVVPLAGYDVPMIPTSGVLSEAVLWMTTAEIAAHRHRDARLACEPKAEIPPAGWLFPPAELTVDANLAAEVLGDATPAGDMEELAADDADTRRMAAWRLGVRRQAGPKVLAALTAALDDDAWQVRRTAAGALGLIAPTGDARPAVLSELNALAADKELTVAITAAYARKLLGDPDAPAALDACFERME